MSRKMKSLRVIQCIAGAVCWLSFSMSLPGADPVPFVTPIEFQSYDVEIQLQGGDRSIPTAQLLARIQPELDDWVARAIGPFWQVDWPLEVTASKPPATTAAPEPTGPGTAANPTGPADGIPSGTPTETAPGATSVPPIQTPATVAAATTAEATAVTGSPDQTVSAGESSDPLASEPVSRPADVRYRIELTQQTGTIRVRVSAEEPTWSHHSPVIEWESSDERELAAAIVMAMARLFRPQAAWERLDETHVQLRIRGGGLAVPDPSLNLVRPDEIFEPHFVFWDRNGKLQREVRIPLTLCVLTEHAEGRGTAEIISGLRNPLASRPRGRVELMAVAARPQWPSTTLELMALSQPPRRLVAHDVHITVGGLPEGETPAPVNRISNRQGEVQLMADPAQRWVMASILSGDQTLAVIPVVAGAQARLPLDLPDDLLRLRVEGQLRLLQGELVAVVAERTALMLAARASAKRRAWPEVDERLKEIIALPTATQFRERVSAIRVPAIALAREQKEKLAERRVDRMCNEAEELIRRYLLDDKIKLLQEEMAELRSVAAETN